MANNNVIEVYQGNTKNFTCTVTGLASLAGYTAKCIVKKNKEDADADKKFELTGTIDGLVISFTSSATNNTQDAGEYYYEVYITDGTNVFTVVQNIYRILESVKY